MKGIKSKIPGHSFCLGIYLLLAALPILNPAFCQVRTDSIPTAVPYQWKNVQIVGGGFVSGFIFHPSERGLVYCRTDMGGAYRRNPNNLRWEPLLDWLSYKERNLMGVESIALDPNNPDRLYMACGTYTNPITPNGAILRSTDRGRTFKITYVPFKMGGNETGRGNGERMAVDPNNSKIILLGTRKSGLWRSEDQGVGWEQVKSFPAVTELPPSSIQSRDSLKRWQYLNQGSGIIFVIFDKSSGVKGKRSQRIFAGVSLKGRSNLFCSEDGGIHWEPVSGQPIEYRPNRAALAADGKLYITYGSTPGPAPMNNGAVWKYDTHAKLWSEISPEKPDTLKSKGFGYVSVSVDAKNPKILLAGTFGRPKGEEIFRSIDGGNTWTPVFKGGGTYDFSLAPYTAFTPIHWLFDVKIDPSNPDHAIFTTGYGGYETYDLKDMDAGKPTHWKVMSTGIEETVALDLLSPPAGASLVSAIGDYGSFVHYDLDKPALEGNNGPPRFGNTSSLACAELRPEMIVRVGRTANDRDSSTLSYSLDGGKSWNRTPSLPMPGCMLGFVSVSADGNTWIWSPESGPGNSTRKPVAVFYTRDRGATWHPCLGLPDNMRVVADRKDPDRFYAVDLFKGKFYQSTDGGVTFREKPLKFPGKLIVPGSLRGDIRGGQDKLYVTPGLNGDLWIAAFDGLYHSINAGESFVKIGKVEELHAFGFGKSAPGRSFPSLYLVGNISGIRGVFRSDDAGSSWVRINDEAHQWGLLLKITGDPKKYGRVFLGTHGRGIQYGDPE